jgi:arylsulfatase
MGVWEDPLSPLRVPKIFDLRADPFERGDESFKYTDWKLEHLFAMYASQAIIQEWLSSFKEFPPRQKSASFSVDQIVEALMPRS